MNVYERMEKENTAGHIKAFIERQKMSYIEKKVLRCWTHNRFFEGVLSQRVQRTRFSRWVG